MSSLACNLTEKDVKFLPIQILLRKICTKKVYFSTINITSKEVGGKNMDFLPRETTQKKCWKQHGCFDHRDYIEKNYVKKA